MTDDTSSVDDKSDPDPRKKSDPLAPTPADLVGRWQAAAVKTAGRRRRVPARMRVTMDFKRGGLLEVVLGTGETRQLRFGTYLVNGKRLTVTLEGYTEIMAFLIKEQRLVLKKRVEPPEVLYLTRLAA